MAHSVTGLFSATLLTIVFVGCTDLDNDAFDSGFEEAEAEAEAEEAEQPLVHPGPHEVVSAADPEGTACISSCQCPQAYVCLAGVCTYELFFGPMPPDPCRSSCQCGYGGLCDDINCIYPNTCSSHCDCGYGMVCWDGVCQADFGPYPTCHCDNQCAFNETCTGDGGGGHCVVSGGGGGGAGGGGGGAGGGGGGGGGGNQLN